MSYIRVWIHYVWATKNRELMLTPDIRGKVFEHIMENAREKNIFIDCINGYTDHVHCLVSLRAGQTIDKTIKLIKGESSFWINKTLLTDGAFEWQTDYWAVSVSEWGIPALRKYIGNQETHHKKHSFDEEYELLIQKLSILPRV